MLKVNCWYQTESNSFVQILGRDEKNNVFIGSIEGKLLCYDADGKPYFPSTQIVEEAPEIYRLKHVEPVPAPLLREYILHIRIEAAIKVKSINVREAATLAPDLIDLRALSDDVLEHNINSIKVIDGHLARAKEPL
ncbi:hypothetical protein [Ktedonobacter racemifer]|uniref:Uncharacterized protein n=1 Tax=Ktedonobacter racemifer DSM 44963 TaxID=485913 RepID=D6TLF9_KTERA|nr:hypothetical protein [Ktedonobacter racemifer]EFH86609.1 hypothetical protein Krac_7914 [Ktedonobacter racemifer DSM 44963]